MVDGDHRLPFSILRRQRGSVRIGPLVAASVFLGSSSIVPKGGHRLSEKTMQKTKGESIVPKGGHRLSEKTMQNKRREHRASRGPMTIAP
ncbi:hypothetical protein [Methylorubrum extorquens]|uniref:hypothetical protein n=1 Tax=Methylorubrum extorquens TaxID=408 RepID=UPI001EE5B893|nr:hypothetical protein [Methylorubrum extorquens]MCG5247888.1 hypothetical protein [Methylorubrum extorquens]